MQVFRIHDAFLLMSVMTLSVKVSTLFYDSSIIRWDLASCGWWGLCVFAGQCKACFDSFALNMFLPAWILSLVKTDCQNHLFLCHFWPAWISCFVETILHPLFPVLCLFLLAWICCSLGYLLFCFPFLFLICFGMLWVAECLKGFFKSFQGVKLSEAAFL